MILLDTDHLSLLQARDAPVAFALQARLKAFSPDEVAPLSSRWKNRCVSRHSPPLLAAQGGEWRRAAPGMPSREH